MDPFSGNAAIGYARINVPGGQKKMWDAPWTSETLRQRPWVDGVNLGQGVDFIRAVFDEDEQLLLLTVRSWDGHKRTIKPVVKNLPDGEYIVTGEKETRTEMIQGGEDLVLEVEVDGEDLDVTVHLQK